MENVIEGEDFTGLTDEQIAREDEFLKGLPRVNLGALFIPPIWGAAHGMWVTLLFYPAWLFADNCIYAATQTPGALSVALALIVAALMIAVTVVFAIVSQPFAAHRAENMGVSRESYLKRQKVWAVVGAVCAVVILALATWYNLCVRPMLGA